MIEAGSPWGNRLMVIEKSIGNPLEIPDRFSDYVILFISDGSGVFRVDASSFNFKGPALLFATPLQTLQLEDFGKLEYSMIKFHSDFYCIETHREEVACNGLLFNNIYISPTVLLDSAEAPQFKKLLRLLEFEFEQDHTADIVLRSYLQLILAKSSSIKLRVLEREAIYRQKDDQMEQFRELLNQHYLRLHKPMEYAAILNISTNLLSKKSVKYFGKTPSQLIQDRLILEAKKKLHLTTNSIKEIAYQMQFADAYYFSRFFKKHTLVSPQEFRNRGGISEVAYLSK